MSWRSAGVRYTLGIVCALVMEVLLGLSSSSQSVTNCLMLD